MSERLTRFWVGQKVRVRDDFEGIVSDVFDGPTLGRVLTVVKLPDGDRYTVLEREAEPVRWLRVVK